jgi:hypothetical protein
LRTQWEGGDEGISEKAGHEKKIERGANTLPVFSFPKPSFDALARRNLNAPLHDVVTRTMQRTGALGGNAHGGAQ